MTEEFPDAEVIFDKFNEDEPTPIKLWWRMPQIELSTTEYECLYTIKSHPELKENDQIGARLIDGVTEYWYKPAGEDTWQRVGEYHPAARVFGGVHTIDNFDNPGKEV